MKIIRNGITLYDDRDSKGRFAKKTIKSAFKRFLPLTLFGIGVGTIILFGTYTTTRFMEPTIAQVDTRVLSKEELVTKYETALESQQAQIDTLLEDIRNDKLSFK